MKIQQAANGSCPVDAKVVVFDRMSMSNLVPNGPLGAAAFLSSVQLRGPRGGKDYVTTLQPHTKRNQHCEAHGDVLYKPQLHAQ